jgi:hypothetical protein
LVCTKGSGKLTGLPTSSPLTFNMPSVSSVAKIYRDQLYSRGNGSALWFPDDEVHPGDVGFLRSSDGTFRRLFNILVDANHSLNSQGVPEIFVPFIPGNKVYCKPNVHTVDKPIVSKEVFATEIGLSADA